MSIFAGLALLVISCTESVPDGPANVQFMLTDAPGDFQEVNIDILSIEVLLEDSVIVLSTEEGIYNLLELTNGKDTLLVDETIPTGYINQVRLILGERNSVMVDSVIHELKTPSAQQSGLKLQVHEELLPGETYVFTIDFVVEKSIVTTGKGKYILKPVIRVYTERSTGAIKGTVMPADAKAMVSVFNETDTIMTLADTLSGMFMVGGLQPGSYSVDFEAEAYADSTISDIVVAAGETTLLDTLFLN